MKITTNSVDTREGLEPLDYRNCGIVTFHGDPSTPFQAEAIELQADGIHIVTYDVKSGDTFNVAYSDVNLDEYILQPQVATNLMFSLNTVDFRELVKLWEGTKKGGIDIIVWHESDKRPLVEIE